MSTPKQDEKRPHHVGVRARDLLDTVTARRIATLSDTDPRSVDRVLLGKPTRGSVRLRIMAALLDCGLADAPLSPIGPSGGASEDPGKP